MRTNRQKIVFVIFKKIITEEQRDEMMQELANHEIAVNVHFIPMPMLSFFKEQGFNIVNYPVSYKNYSCEISLPIYPQLTNEEVDFVIETIKNAYTKIVQKK